MISKEELVDKIENTKLERMPDLGDSYEKRIYLDDDNVLIVGYNQEEKFDDDYETGKYAPGFYWHANDAGVPLSGQPNRFAYADPRFGLSYDVLGTGNTIVRGGWGVYRFVTQVNTVANGEAAGTAAQVLGYGTPGGRDIQLQNIGNLAYVACPNPLTGTLPTSCGTQGGQTGLDASNYGQPMTQAYNLTIDQKLKWNTQIEIAYVGSKSSQLVQMGEDIWPATSTNWPT